MIRPWAGAIRTYATRSKTTNLKMAPQVPLEKKTLSDGSVFVTRKAPISPEQQATAPPLRPPYDKKRNVTDAQIEEMRQLRAQDPALWTRKKLAEKYQCSEVFVSMAAPRPVPTGPIPLSHEAGYRRQLITRERQRRRALW